MTEKKEPDKKPAEPTSTKDAVADAAQEKPSEPIEPVAKKVKFVWP